MAAWGDDAVFRAHAGWSTDATRADLLAFWHEQLTEPEQLTVRRLALEQDAVVGYAELPGDDDRSRELGYLVAPSSNWGRGLGTAIAGAGLAHGFQAMGLERIWAEALEANRASVRILRALGMRETGFGEEETFLGAPSRYVCFELTRGEWLRHRS